MRNLHKPCVSERNKRQQRQQLARHAQRSPGRCIVAEGDSWFSLWTRQDLIDHLVNAYDLPIVCLADPGTTLTQMAFAHEVDRNTGAQVGTSRLEKTLETIARCEPSVFLFSGGGNDIAGPELMGLLQPASLGLGMFDEARVEAMIEGTLRRALVHVYEQVQAVQPGLAMVTHGYAHPIPDGRHLRIGLGLFRIAGPWLRPALEGMGWTDLAQNTTAMADLMDRFNAMQQGLVEELDHFHHVDLRAVVVGKDAEARNVWRDELHLKWHGYRRAARAMGPVIQGLMP